MTALREVKLLRELRSPYVVRLLDVLPQRRGLALVMEFCESDLEHVIKDRSRLLSAGDVKAYMQVGAGHCAGGTTVRQGVAWLVLDSACVGSGRCDGTAKSVFVPAEASPHIC